VINPNALVWLGICTVGGFLLGSWAWGLLAGLVVLAAYSAVYDP
jgi:hypothetical protein